MGANDSFDDYVPPPEPVADYGDFGDFADFEQNTGGSNRFAGGDNFGGSGKGGQKRYNKYGNNRGDVQQEYRTPPHDERAERLSLIHISEPTRLSLVSRMPSSA